MINAKSSGLIILAFVLLIMLLLPSIAQDKAAWDASKKFLNARSEQYRNSLEKVKASLVEIKVDRYSEEQKYPEEVQVKFNRIKASVLPRPNMPVCGFVVSADGFIATSAFNVSGRINGIKVKLADNREFDARIAGVDEKHDIAILQIKADNLVVPEFSDSEAEINEQICAVGMSSGKDEHFIDAGTVTGSTTLETKHFVMNINANYGNAGAPVINLKGQVLGMLNLVSTKSIFNQNTGIGFFLPAETVNADYTTLSQSLSKILVSQPYIGLTLQNAKPDAAELYIDTVMPNTGAAFGGIQNGDVLNRINNVLITFIKADSEDEEDISILEKFQMELGRYEIGDTIQITVIRNSVVVITDVVLSEKWLNPGY